jgi:uncharacterized membrane protein YjfL (UPF0719 family)
MNFWIDWNSFGRSIAFVALALVFLFVGKILADLLTRYNDDAEVREKANLALALRRAGMYIGLAAGLAGSLLNPGEAFVSDLRAFAIDGALVVGILLLAQILNEKVMLRTLKTHEAVRNGNVAVGAVEFGQFVATGLIFGGSFSGEGNIQSAIVFAALGQLALLLVFAIEARLSPWSVREEIGGGNLAAGVMLGSRLLAIGIILRNSVAGDSTTLGNDVLSFASYLVFGIVTLWVTTWVADLLFLPKTRVKDAIASRNVAATAMLGGIAVATAIIVWAST